MGDGHGGQGGGQQRGRGRQRRGQVTAGEQGYAGAGAEGAPRRRRAGAQQQEQEGEALRRDDACLSKLTAKMPAAQVYRAIRACKQGEARSDFRVVSDERRVCEGRTRDLLSSNERANESYIVFLLVTQCRTPDENT